MNPPETEAFVRDQQDVLERIAKGAPLNEILVRMTGIIERQAPGLLCSILLFDRTGPCLRHGAAPSLPPEYNALVEGHAVGPDEGSCGTAAHRREPVFADDIATDPVWSKYRDIMARFSLASCWSTPFFAADGRLLGTFAMYYRQPRKPEPFERRLIEVATHLAGIAVEQSHLQDERQRLEAELRQAQKMEAIGRLAGGIAHDFNNLLTVINAHSELLLTDRGLAPEAAEGLEQIHAAGQRAAALTRQLLAFSRKQVIAPQPLDVNEAIGNIGRLLRRVIGEHIALQVRLEAEVPPVTADVAMFEQVLVNLAINARDAMPNGGAIRIETDPVTVTSEQAKEHPQVSPGRFVRIRVSDTGTGIAPEILPHIFEPFFTTKPAGIGTGLGLASVLGTLEQHHGWVEVNSAPGHGAVFDLYWPASPGPTLPAAAGASSGPTPHGTETVLLVEDEDCVRRIGKTVLSRLGYRVLEAASGTEAMEIWRRRRGEIALMITDQIMPGGLSGSELASRLMGERPELGVIFTSGYTGKAEYADPSRGIHFLPKPFDAERLARLVRQAIDETIGAS